MAGLERSRCECAASEESKSVLAMRGTSVSVA
jgi:hypothetical protein